MSLFNVRAALVTAWQTLGITTYFENDLGEPTDKHATFEFMPSSTNGVSLGANGKDEHLGLLQIDLYYPVSRGNGELLQQLDTIRAYFYNGRGFVYGGTSVIINRVDYSSPVIDGGWYRQSISLYWYSRGSR